MEVLKSANKEIIIEKKNINRKGTIKKPLLTFLPRNEAIFALTLTISEEDLEINSYLKFETNGGNFKIFVKANSLKGNLIFYPHPIKFDNIALTK